LGKEGDEECHDCAVTPAGPVASPLPESPATPSSAKNLTIRKVVDEVAVYFTATKSGQYVNDLQLSDLELRDDGKPAAKIQQFAPQAKLPMRLALVIDTSGSVEHRFSFEKKAAERFLRGMLTNPTDLALVMGFSNQHNVTQEFTSNLDQLSAGVETLTNGGGTALFDAVLFACQKLSAYPDRERAARVVVVLSDGEDNSSKVSLRSVIQVANASGITIYAISTKEAKGKDGDWGQPTTTADHILEALTERTGGEALFPAEINLLGRRFDKLHDIIRNRYLIAYRPADFEADGHYRRISIKAAQDGKPLAIRARQGYYAQIQGSASIPDPK
ncbi:MAG TPA: VWA domain-containing protein, partial [Terriglobales bacterium]|nr:VWA domain-containing protein [Terriglobales bacterium]